MREQSQYEICVLFDRSTGAIIGTHSVYEAETRTYRMPTHEEIWAAFHTVLPDYREDQVDIITATLPTPNYLGGYYVDVVQRKLVPQLQLQMWAERTQILGDGKDEVEISISAVDASGEVVESFHGDLRVRTSRGRLSSLGGRINAHNGCARITLTSVAETIECVSVTVKDLSGHCTSGRLDMEFL